jgi:hypothetical protein
MSRSPLLQPVGVDFTSLTAEARRLALKGTLISEFQLRMFCHILAGKIVFYYDKVNPVGTEYLPLSSQILKGIMGNSYSHAIDFLEDEGIIESDDWFIKGKKCIGYRFHRDVIMGGFSPVYFDASYKNRQALRRYRERASLAQEDAVNIDRSHLLKTINDPRLTVDPIGYEFLDNLYNPAIEKAKRKLSIHPDNTRARAQLLENQNNYNRQQTLLDLINGHLAGDSCKSDGKGWRFHSPFVQMKRELRQYLRFDGQPLMEIDIKGSQPYILTLLFQEQFYRKEAQKEGLYLNNIHKGLYKHINTSINKYIPFMYPISSESPCMIDPSFDEYTRIIEDEKEDIYTEIQKGMVELGRTKKRINKSRKKVKRAVLTYLFSPPHIQGMLKSDIYRFFEEAFSAVSSLLQDLKSYQIGIPIERTLPFVDERGNIWKSSVEIDQGYKAFAHLLQRIEAVAVLDIICKEIAQEWPQIPLITVHDCILTTPENVDLVKEYFSRRLHQLIGVRPQLEVKKNTALIPVMQ